MPWILKALRVSAMPLRAAFALTLMRQSPSLLATAVVMMAVVPAGRRVAVTGTAEVMAAVMEMVAVMAVVETARAVVTVMVMVTAIVTAVRMATVMVMVTAKIRAFLRTPRIPVTFRCLTPTRLFRVATSASGPAASEAAPALLLRP